MPIKNFTTTGTQFSIVYDGLTQGTWDRLDELDSKYDIDVRDSSATLSLRNPGFSDVLKAGDTIQVNGVELSGTFRQKMDALKNKVLYLSSPGSALPVEYPDTYAAMQTSITADPTTKRDFFVSADETNGGLKTSYRYDGSISRALSNPMQRNTIVLFGDSLTNLNYVYPPSDNFNWAAIGYFGWYQVYAGCPFDVLRNSGISGNKTSDMLARINADVLAYSPKYCLVLGGTNDFADTPATDTISNLTQIYQRLYTAGITPILCTVPVRSDGYGGSTIATQRQAQVNVFIKEWAQQHKLCCWDMEAATINKTASTYQGVAAYFRDGIHFNAQGASAVAVQGLSDLSALGLSSYKYPLGANPRNAYHNPNLLTTTGGYYLGAGGNGTIPDSVQIYTGGDYTKLTASLVSRADGGGNWLQVDAAFTTPSYYSIIASLYLNATTPEFITGDKMDVCLRYETDNVWTSSRFLEVSLEFRNSSDSVSYGRYSYGYNANLGASDYLGTTPKNGVIYFKDIVVPSGTSIIKLATGINATVSRIRITSIYMIKKN